MMTSGRMLIGSGIGASATSTFGFFSAGILHLGAAATVSTLVTAAAAGAVGGFMLYCPVVVLRLCMHRLGVLNGTYRLALAALDLLGLGLAGPVGAYCLGLAVQPFLIAAAVAVTLYLVTNLIRLNFTAPSNDGLIDAFASDVVRSHTTNTMVDSNPALYITPSLGSYC